MMVINKKTRRFLIPLLVLMCLWAVISCGCGNSQYQKLDFSYQSGAQDESSTLYYSDSFFQGPSTQYHPSLATASLSFAMASFSSMKELEYTHRFSNIEKLLDKAGFSDFYANDFYHIKPEMDSMGVVLASKMLEDKRLIYIGLRGANYEGEWASNFTIGDGGATPYHQGFYTGSEIVLKELKNYVQALDIQGDIKLWISGYSRAGAVTNITAGRIDEYLRDGVAFLGDGIRLRHEDLYAYCFESPQGVPYDASCYPKSDLFNNIFCIVNRNDPVPKVVMNALSFTRYGVEIVLPDTVTDLQFAQHIEPVAYYLNHLRSFGDWGEYQVTNFRYKTIGSGKSFFTVIDHPGLKNWTQGLFLDDLLQRWTEDGLHDRAFYTEHFQSGLRDLFRLAYARKTTSSSLKDMALQLGRELLTSDESEIVIDDLMHNIKQLPKDFEPLLQRALMRLGIDVELDKLTVCLGKLLGSLFQTLAYDPDVFYTCLSLDNFKAIASAHYPELCLAFMRAMDPLYNQDPIQPPLDGTYYILTAPEGTRLRVFSGDAEVAAIQGDLPLDTEYLVPYGLYRQKILAYLPAHENYQVTVSDASEIELVLVEPRQLSAREQSIRPEKADGGYRFTIPAVP